MQKPEERAAGPILLLDDDAAFVRGFLRWLTRRHGFDRFELMVTHDIETATDALRASRRFAGFLVDWRLGYDLTGERTAEPLLRRIRQLYPSTHTPVYVPTACAQADDVVRAAAIHGALVIPKRHGEHWRHAGEQLDENRARVRETERWLRERAPLEPLRPRELMLAAAVLDGATAAEIADALGVSAEWVSEVDRAAAAKLGLRRLAALWADEVGVVAPVGSRTARGG